MTTNGQLNDTRGYHIKPTNYTCNMISCFRLKYPCSFVRGKTFVLSAQSNFNYCRKVLSMKNIWINIETKTSKQKSVLRWKFASVYVAFDICGTLRVCFCLFSSTGLMCLFSSTGLLCLFSSNGLLCLFSSTGLLCLFSSNGLLCLFSSTGLLCLFSSTGLLCLFSSAGLLCLFSSTGLMM